jgi:hypothetical protein
VIDDKTGFQPIFDGTSLKGWDGDPAFLESGRWRDRRRELAGERG